MKKLFIVFLVFALLGFSATVSAQGLTIKNTQKIKLRITGIDASGTAVSEPLPVGAVVTFTMNQEGIADFVPDTTTDPLGELWFVPKAGVFGSYEIRATLVLGGDTFNTTLPVTITRDYPQLTRVVIAVVGEPVAK